MNRNQLTWVVAAMVVGTMLSYAHGVQTTVRLDVVTPDPNDANAVPGDAPLIEATANQPIAYAITAIVEADDANLSGDPNYVKGLAAAYVTLNTNFGDANLVREANVVNAVLTPLGTVGLGCVGLVRGDDVTDIGGSQRLLGESPAPSVFANGQRVTIAEGQLTAPSQDGICHVCVTPQEVRILDANVAEPPYSLTPDNVFAGQGFFVVVGDCNYYTLVVYNLDDTRGHVEADPYLPSYPEGMEVTLTAVAKENKQFEEWQHYDANVPFDPNWLDDPCHFTYDTNNPTTVVMDRNRIIGVSFGCGSGLMATLAGAGLLGVTWLVRRRR